MKPAYTIPPTPTSVGGFDGRALIWALFVLLVANVCATQYAAAQFKWQSALGRPMFCWARKTPCVYVPWAWATWTAKTMLNSRSEEAVRWTLVKSYGIVLGGFFAAWITFYIAQSIRVRQQAAQAKHLHGSAQWASRKDIIRSDLMTAAHGVYVGAWRDRKKLRYLRHNGPDHVLAFAPTRTGKGVSLVIPTLLAWTQSAVVYDIKGENWERSAGFRATLGPCFRFAPAETENTCRFNPLAELRLNTEHDVADVMRIAEMLGAEVEGGNNPYWPKAGKALLNGAILHTAYVAATQGGTASLGDVYRTLVAPGKGFRQSLADWMLFPHKDGQPHPTVQEAAQSMLDKEDQDFGGVLSSARACLLLYADPIAARATSASDFKIADLVNSERPVSVYIVVPASQQERLRPLVRLMFTLLVNRLTDVHTTNRHRLLMLIDEFPTLGNMPIFAHALSYMGGYGIKAFLIAQDIRQIEAAYGHKESIVSNCNVRVAFAPNTFETAQLLSNMLGKQTVLRTAYSFSGKRLAPMPGSMSTSMDHRERELLTADEIMRLRPPVKTGEGPDEKIVFPGDMLIFQAGHRPVLGTQILYFMDPELMRRSSLAPPEQLTPAAPPPQRIRYVTAPEPVSEEITDNDTLFPV